MSTTATAMSKIFLGRVHHGVTEGLGGEPVYLTKHQWDCNWYWGMGYVGNALTHTHFDSQFLGGEPLEAYKVFSETSITDSEWWVIRDLFIQAYALQKAAAVYLYGGHQTSKAGLTDLISSADKAKDLNADLERVLDALWDYACAAVKPNHLEAA